jgi:hypothetical protein
MGRQARCLDQPGTISSPPVGGRTLNGSSSPQRRTASPLSRKRTVREPKESSHATTSSTIATAATSTPSSPPLSSNGDTDASSTNEPKRKRTRSSTASSAATVVAVEVSSQTVDDSMPSTLPPPPPPPPPPSPSLQPITIGLSSSMSSSIPLTPLPLPSPLLGGNGSNNYIDISSMPLTIPLSSSPVWSPMASLHSSHSQSSHHNIWPKLAPSPSSASSPSSRAGNGGIDDWSSSATVTGLLVSSDPGHSRVEVPTKLDPTIVLSMALSEQAPLFNQQFEAVVRSQRVATRSLQMAFCRLVSVLGPPFTRVASQSPLIHSLMQQTPGTNPWKVPAILPSRESLPLDAPWMHLVPPGICTPFIDCLCLCLLYCLLWIVIIIGGVSFRFVRIPETDEFPMAMITVRRDQGRTSPFNQVFPTLFPAFADSKIKQDLSAPPLESYMQYSTNRAYERLMGASPHEMLQGRPIGWQQLLCLTNMDEARALARIWFRGIAALDREFSLVITLTTKVISFDLTIPAAATPCYQRYPIAAH